MQRKNLNNQKPWHKFKKRSCALLHIDVNKGACNQHNPHHTGHIQICKQDTVGSPLPA